MARYLFIAQQTLDTWMEQDKIDFENDVMKIKADGRAFKLIEAVRFVAVEGGVPDEPGLVGKVKTTEQLRQMGAERCADSVLYKDIPYKVQEGFIAEVFIRQQKKAEESPAGPHAAGAAVTDATGRPEGAAGAGRPVHVDDSGKSQAASASAATSGEQASNGGEELSDAELLTKFLLENM